MRLYEFVSRHVMPFNAVIVMSTTVAAVLDFMAPQAPYLAWVSYVLAALVLLAMVLEVQYQRSPSEDAWPVRLLGRLRPPPGPLWKSPAWQAVGVIALIALALGQASKAKAGEGGLIASAAPNLRNVQMLLLGIKEDTQRIQATLNNVDTKVNSIHASVEGLQGVLAKEPIEYLMEGDYPALKKHVAAGKRLPRNTDMLVKGLNQKRDDRFDLLRLYMDNQFDIREPVELLMLVSSDDLPTIKNVKKLDAWAQKRFQASASTLLYQDCKTLDLLAYAYIAGDKPLAEWLVQQGMKPDTQYHCENYSRKWTVSAKELQTLMAQ